MSKIDIYDVDVNPVDLSITAELTGALRSIFKDRTDYVVVTGDIRSDLAQLPFGKDIEDATWCASEPESLDAYYMTQVSQGAQAVVALTGRLCETQLKALGLDHQAAHIVQQALREARKSAARWLFAEVLCDAEVFGVASDHQMDEGARRRVRIEVKNLLEAATDIHGVWIEVTTPELLSDVLEGISLVCDVPCVVSFDCDMTLALAAYERYRQRVDTLSDVALGVQVASLSDIAIVDELIKRYPDIAMAAQVDARLNVESLIYELAKRKVALLRAGADKEQRARFYACL